MKRTIKVTACICTAVTLISLALCRVSDVFFTIAITFGTTAYHFLMRLAVGYAVDAVMHNSADYTKIWFQPRRFEKKLYKKLNVKSWKGKMPSYDPSLFSIDRHTPDEIIGAMCQAEIVHEIIVVLSFLPILTIPFFGEPLVFVLTSLAAACFDMLFVIMQRYNRPRILKLMSRGNYENPGNKRQP